METGRKGRIRPVAEIELVKRAVRAGAPGAGLVGDDSDGLTGAVDWPRLVELARAHGVLALVARSLKARGWDGVPPDVVGTLAGYRAGLTARNLFLSRRLLDILDLLAAHGITALPYKGPVLAAYAYGDVGMRPFTDLDVIVSASDVLPARDLLTARGYTSMSRRTESERPGALPPGYALALRGADGGALVELHWRLAPSFPLEMKDLLPGATPFPLLGSSVPCLGPEQLLLVLCVHGAKHAWERLEWVCAVAHLVAARPDVDWGRLAADARTVGARRSVALGLALAVAVAGAPVPEAAMRATGATRVGALAAGMEKGILARLPGADDAVARYSLRFRARSARERARYFLFLGHPTEKDRAFVDLPGRLSFLYFVVRPLRVLHEHRPRRSDGRSAGGADARQARRALTRQLEHQAVKAKALQGREDEMSAALAVRWDRVWRRLERAGADWADPRLLEVGSGAHGILFGSGRPRAVGVDPLAVSYAGMFPAWQRRVPTVAGVGERLPFGDGSFDIVLCDNVVDHCENPAAVLAEIVRVLPPGGLLYFTVNVHHRLYSVVARAHRAWNAAGIRLEIGPFADHTVHLTPAEAGQLIRDLPLEILHEKTYVAEARERARRRPLRHPGHLLPLVFFKNARYQVVARRL
jgi:SAM-dependent methyltransferase